LVNRVKIEYSSDAGKTWQVAAENIDADAGKYNWITPKIYSDSVMIVISDQNDNKIKSENPYFFQIHPAILDFVNPSNKNGFEKNTDVNISWNKEFVETVDLFFTTNGGSNWELVAGDLAAVVTKVEIPDISSDNCKFKLVNKPVGDLVVESVEFSVGDPSATATSPISGDVIDNDGYVVIDFDYKNLSEFYLYYSLDDGENWKKISPVAYTTDKLPIEWSTTKTSKLAKIKLVTKSNKDLVVAETQGTFEIREKVTSVEQLPEVISNMAVMQVIPNPVTNDAVVVLNINELASSKVDVKLYHSVGYQVQLPLSRFNVHSGINELNINLEAIPVGSYMLVVANGEHRATYPIRVVR
jgi:hypothetical protein